MFQVPTQEYSSKSIGGVDILLDTHVINISIVGCDWIKEVNFGVRYNGRITVIGRQGVHQVSNLV